MSEFPLISVITPIFNGQNTIERAIRSVQRQTFNNWEFLAVDDCSTDDTYKILKEWTEKDPRIRIFQTTENSATPAGRNLALSHARGQYVCYLDCDDEYYPDYLENVAKLGAKADVLIFNYDIKNEDWKPGDEIKTWHPEQLSSQLFFQGMSVPLGIAHRRDLIDKTGGFNELLWNDEDTDILRRFARSGAEFLFLPLKSGCYWQRNVSRSRIHRLTSSQRLKIETNWQSGKPIYDNSCSTTPSKKIKNIAFASRYSLVDFTNGASIATLQNLQFLQELGFNCQVFSGTHTDAPEEIMLEEILAKQQAPYEVRNARIGEYPARFIFTIQGRLPVTMFETASTQKNRANEEEAEAFLSAFATYLDSNRLDALLTYGGDPISQGLISMAKCRDIPVIFGLHNFSYPNVNTFKAVDYVLVPSEYSRQYHWDKLGLACHYLPNVTDVNRVFVKERQPQYVTFINPDPNKGVYIFAGIAEELARRRPDIPLLVVEGRGKTKTLEQTGLNLKQLPNLRIMPNTHDPRQFYSLSKILLLPSLWLENAPLVVAEGMLNGIPILAGNRGGLPEMIGEAGFIFDIPAKYTPQTREVPSAEEVEPWIETIIRLWDDAVYYQKFSQLAIKESQRWHPEQLKEVHTTFFSNITHQPGPPFVPRH